MKIVLTNLNYVSKIKSVRSKREDFVFGLLSAFLLLCLLISPAGAAIDWKISPSNPAVGDTLKIQGMASPGEKIKAEVSFEKEIPVSEGRYQYLLESIKVPEGNNNRFTVSASGVKNLHVGVNKVAWVNLQSEASGGVATISKTNIPPWTYKIIIDGDSLSRSSVYLQIKASQTLKANSKGKFEYSYDTSSMPEGKFRIRIGNSAKTIELKSTGQNELVADFSAAPTSGKAPLKVTFTDLSAGSPTSWKWSFGDGKYSTDKNAVHTYSKAGKYAVTLKAKNANGIDTEIKSGYITVSKNKWYVDNVAFRGF